MWYLNRLEPILILLLKIVSFHFKILDKCYINYMCFICFLHRLLILLILKESTHALLEWHA